MLNVRLPVVVAVNVMLEVPASHVRLVVVDIFQTVPDVLVSVHVPEPILNDLAPVPVPENVPIVMLGLLTLKSIVPVKAPHVSDVIVLVPLIVAATVTVPPPLEPSNVTVSPEAGTD